MNGFGLGLTSLIRRVGGGGPGPEPGPVSATQWRLFVTEIVQPDSFWINLANIEMMEVVAGPNVVAGGTATASSEHSGGTAAANAFDGNISNVWSSLSGQGGPQWVAYEFPDPVAIVEITIRAGDSIARRNRAPEDFEIQYFDTDTSTWVTVASYTGEPAWGTSEMRIYSAQEAAPAAGYQQEGRFVLGYGGTGDDEFTTTTGLNNTVDSSFATTLAFARDCCIDNDGNLLILVGTTVHVMDGISGTTLSTVSLGGFSTNTRAIAIDRATGNLIAYDGTSHLIYVLDGVSNTIISSFASTYATSSTGLTVDNLGNVIQANNTSQQIAVYVGKSATVAKTISIGTTANPTSLDWDQSRRRLALLSSTSTGSVRFYDIVSNAIVQTVSPTPAAVGTRVAMAII
jgi:hypothetical protein